MERMNSDGRFTFSFRINRSSFVASSSSMASAHSHTRVRTRYVSTYATSTTHFSQRNGMSFRHKRHDGYCKCSHIPRAPERMWDPLASTHAHSSTANHSIKAVSVERQLHGGHGPLPISTAPFQMVQSEATRSATNHSSTTKTEKHSRDTDLIILHTHRHMAECLSHLPTKAGETNHPNHYHNSQHTPVLVHLHCRRYWRARLTRRLPYIPRYLVHVGFIWIKSDPVVDQD